MTEKTASSAPKPREIELDFIRGIAILMVIDYHSPGHSLVLAPFQWLGFVNFGWAGVDIFFVLSGFLVGGLLVKEWKLRGRIDARQFLIRRGFKIWPQYYVFLLIILFSGHRTFHDLLGNFLNLQNYLGGIAHTWTLAVEEHAYLLLVLILAVAARTRLHIRHVFLFLVVASAGVILNAFIQSRLISYDFVRTDTRIDGIFFGVLLAILYHYVPERFAALQSYRLAWLTVIAITLSAYRFLPAAWWVGPLHWFLSDMSGVAILLLLYHHRPGHRRPALYRFIAAIGLYSYGIYLWHISTVDPIRKLATHLPPALVPWWLTTAPYVFGILLGVFFTKLVEFPALKLRDHLFPRRVDSAVGVPAEIEAEAATTKAK